jgi:hypothetical protein
MKERLEKDRIPRAVVPEDSVKVDRPGGGTSIRALVQLVLVVIGWCLFLWAWVSVMRFTALETVVATIVLLAALAVVIEAINLLWIRHNINIFKKKGPRKSVPQVRYESQRDFLGRRQVADWQNLRGEALIIVGFNDERKIFTPGGGFLPKVHAVEELANYLKPNDESGPPGGEKEAK